MNALKPHRGLAIAALATACAFGLVVALLAGGASATTYTDTAAINGSVTLDAGSITFSSAPASSVAFGDGTGHFRLTGTDQVIAANAATQFDVTDATGSGNGWTVSASAPAFTCGLCGTPPTGGTKTLGALEVNGASSPSTATSLSVACDTACTGPGTSNYDIATKGIITVGTSSTPIFDQPANDGMGTVKISSLYWLLTVPYNAMPGSYTSVITLHTSSGPSNP